MRKTLRGMTVATVMVGLLAVGAVGAFANPFANPAELPPAGFGQFNCGGDVGIVRIPGHGSRTGFSADGRLWKVQLGTMAGLAENNETCFDPASGLPAVTVVLIR